MGNINSTNRKFEVHDKLDELGRSAKNLRETVQEITTLNHELRRLSMDPSHHRRLGEATTNYLEISEELQTAHRNWGRALKLVQDRADVQRNDEVVTQKVIVADFGNRPSTGDEIINSMQQAHEILDALARATKNLPQTIRDIASVNLDLGWMSAEPSYHHVLGEEETQQYLQLSEQLQSTKSEWDWALYFVKRSAAYDGDYPPADFRHLLDYRLCEKPHVTEIDVQLAELIKPDGGRVDENVSAMLHYIRSSPILHKVSIRGDTTPVTETLATTFLETIRRNGHIKELCCSLKRPPAALGTLLSTSSSIQALEIDCFGASDLSQQGRDLLTTAISSSQSVESLRLCTRDNGTMIDSILQNLEQSSKPLQKLAICSVQNYLVELPSLTSFLANTTTLKHVETSCDWIEDNLECLLEGLRRHYGTTPFGTTRLGTITKISFCFTIFVDSQTASKFVQFMQSPTNENDVALQELKMHFYLEEAVFYLDEEVPFMLGMGMAAFIAKVAETDPESNTSIWVPTIGSQLQLLSLRPFRKMKNFLPEMRSHAQEISLPKLCLSDIGYDECVQLKEYVPYLQSLQELHLERVFPQVAPETVLAIYRSCGSVQQASVLGFDNDPFLKDPHSRVLDAYCKRNQVLRSPNRVWSWSHHGTTVDPEQYDQAQLLPLLLQVSQQVPSMHLSSILSALLRFEEVDGPANPAHQE